MYLLMIFPGLGIRNDSLFFKCVEAMPISIFILLMTVRSTSGDCFASVEFDFFRKKRKKFFSGLEDEGALATSMFEGAAALITFPLASTLTDWPNLFALRMTSSASCAVW